MGRYPDDQEIVFNNDPGGTCEEVGTQSPIPVSGDAVYMSDIWLDESDQGDFDGSITDLFNNLHTVITDVTANNPKELLIHFNRTVVSNAIGLGAASGDFSHGEIEIGNSGGVFTTVIDESTDNTDYTSRTFNLQGTVAFNAIRLIFHTADPVTLSNCVILISRGVVARVHGPNGLEYAQDPVTGDRISIDHPHSEIHEGRNFTAWSNQEPVTSIIIAFKVGDQPRIPHMTLLWRTEETGTATWYRGATWTTGTGTAFAPINSNHNSSNTSILEGDSSGAFVDDEVVIDPTGLSVGSATIVYEESTWATNQSPASPGEGQRREQDLLPGETYAVEVTCGNGGARIFLDWYEHIPTGE